ncbi:MAG: 2-hydroxyglutaryl-CoA dehydratase [Ruminococcaceae bacterium]|nr:2-hydroxyglutaryl-CoA dehydratase [Oscillospiraceae bacterium]
MKRLGIDIGSTTIKCALFDENGALIHKSYERHKSKISEKMAEVLRAVHSVYPDERVLLSVSGSAGMGLSTDMELPFVQEVYATRIAVKERFPETDAVIELGGEDAKILFLSDGMEIRMNGTCAGGTGAFIDQMAELMNVTSDDMDILAQKREKIYTIASRCGVFAKSDVQPLLNQGARKEDIAGSILYAVVNQTVGGLAQGRRIEGNVLYLGGPLTFFGCLRAAFDDVLGIVGTCPENSLYFVAIGAAYSSSSREFDLCELADRVEGYSSSHTYLGCAPLFSSKDEFYEFAKRHNEDSAGICTLTEPAERMYLGIDAGSTTIKAVLCDENGNLFRPLYTPNSGNPVPLIKDYLEALYRDYPDIHIAGAAATGYGEQIISSAFHIDHGIVETIAHYTAAKHFCPDVDFILDIGGQDIKCFRIKNGAIDNIFLNEACSSGCGSFLQTFAGVLGYSVKDFAQLALFADAPVDLGSRCTVFMNSSVKQAQKDGATIENISAGLSISVVKNALYKVIRCVDPAQLGKKIVVQGGTFLNDAVLRAFEQESGREVLRPSVAGLMGAYGAALFAKEKTKDGERSRIVDAVALANFKHDVKAFTCKGCNNRCRLTVNTFSTGEKYIAGNRCEKPLEKKSTETRYNLYEDKLALLAAYRKNESVEGRPTVGIPMGLNMYELLPFWHTLFTNLGYNVIVSGESNHKLYVKGQHTIPSDTVCYPAKLLHGHMEDLFGRGVDMIFYPSMTYNLDESLGANHYNCPVVAYYPALLKNNVRFPKDVSFINGFVGLHNPKLFVKYFTRMMAGYGIALKPTDVKRAAEAAYGAHHNYVQRVRELADEYLEIAKRENRRVIVLAGRPYHMDPEINHGIDRLITDMGAIVVTEDSVAYRAGRIETTVLNQWTYHSRLYSAARFVGQCKDLKIDLVQLVSFGCGVDAVTTDETRAIIESAGKLYTQIKIDEITNLGAVKIRLRSLFAVLDS